MGLILGVGVGRPDMSGGCDIGWGSVCGAAPCVGVGPTRRCRRWLRGLSRCTRGSVGRRCRRSRLLRALLAQMLYTVRSERMLVEQMEY